LRRAVWLFFVGLFPTLPAVAQQSATPSPPVISVSTRLVQVDLIATDKAHKTVRDLKPEEIQVFENGHAQKIASFEYHLASSSTTPPIALPKGVYSNRRPMAENSSATILLLDALNTPFLDQAYARDQMLKYVRAQATANQQIAIFALTHDLLLLQDFTSDPKLLLSAAERVSIQPSPLLNDPDADALYLPGAPAQVIENLKRFEDESIAAKTDVRVRITLAALESLARIVAGVPGRKTLVWVSGAFPLNLRPREGFDTQRWYLDQVERTSTLLNDAQIAVYPVDARGLVGSPLASGAFTGLGPNGRLMSGSELADELASRSFQLSSSQAAMEDIADLTGGAAYYNRNDIDHAVALAVEDGSSYYALSYYPADKKWDGRFRKIEIKSLRQGLALRYRRGYYAVDPAAAGKMRQKDVENEIASAVLQPLLNTEVTFFASVAARMSAISKAVPEASTTLPVQFLIDIKNLGFDQLSGGDQHCSLEIAVAAFSRKKLFSQMTKHEECDFPADTYSRLLKHGLVLIVPIDLPAGSYRLRLLVRDNLRGRLGTLDIPYTQSKKPAAR